MTQSQVRQQMWLGALAWLAIGAGLGFFVFQAWMARVDWPVAFSRADDFVPVAVYPVDAQVTWDWSRFGGDQRRPAADSRYAVWLSVVYQVDGQNREGRVKYASRMSWCGAQGNAHWALEAGNAPVEVLMNVTDPSILAASTYEADRAADVVFRLVFLAVLTVAWLVSPFHMARKLARMRTSEPDEGSEEDDAEADGFYPRLRDQRG